MKWIGSIAAALLCGATLLGGIASCEKAPEAGQKVFVMVPKGIHSYYEPCWQGFQDAAKKYGVEVKKSEPTKFELPLQVQTLESVIASKPTGIAISALDDKGLKNIIDKASDAGIKVITFDAPAPSSKELCYVGTANDKAGYDAGVEIAKLMNNEGEVAILEGGIGTLNLDDRFEGFKKALAEKAPKISIVAREDTHGDLAEATTRTENILTAHPNLKAIFGVSSECVPGVISVLKRPDNTKTGLIVAGFDDDPATIAGIKAGIVQFCIVQKTYKMGWVSLEMLLDASNGKSIPTQVDTGVTLVTKANVDTYMQDAVKEFSGK